MLVKYISENRVEPYKGLVEMDGIVYTNDEAKASEAGFKPLIIEVMPVAVEGYYPVSYYKDEEEAVRMCWRLEFIGEESV